MQVLFAGLFCLFAKSSYACNFGTLQQGLSSPVLSFARFLLVAECLYVCKCRCLNRQLDFASAASCNGFDKLCCKVKICLCSVLEPALDDFLSFFQVFKVFSSSNGIFSWSKASASLSGPFLLHINSSISTPQNRSCFMSDDGLDELINIAFCSKLKF